MSKHIDHIFRQRLADGALPVSNDMWNRLEPFLPEAGKRDRGFIFWLLGAGVFVIAAVMLWWLGASGDESPVRKDLREMTTLMSSGTNTESIASVAPEQSDGVETENVVAFTPGHSDAPVRQTAEAKSSDQRTSSAVNPVEASLNIQTTIDPHKSNAAQAAEQDPHDGHEKASVSANARKAMPFLMIGNLMLSEEERKLPDPTKDCYDFGRKNSGGGGWFAEVYGGPTYSLRSLSSRNENVSAYIAGRDSTESSRVSWHAGLRGGYVHGTGISVRLGAHYTAVNELFDYYDGSHTQTVYTFDTIRDMSGNIIDIVADTIQIQGQRIKTTHNRYHTIDVPLLVGYQATSNHWTYGIQAGPVFNVAFWKKGDILSPVDGMPVTITDDDPGEYPAFRDQLGLSIYASVHLGRRIGYRTVIYAEPHLHHRLRSLTLDNYPVDQKQTNIGLSVGLRYMLN